MDITCDFVFSWERGFKSILFLWKPFLKTYALKSGIYIESNQHYRTIRKMFSKIMRKNITNFRLHNLPFRRLSAGISAWSLSLQNLSVWKLKFVIPWVCHSRVYHSRVCHSRVCLSEVLLFRVFRSGFCFFKVCHSGVCLSDVNLFQSFYLWSLPFLNFSLESWGLINHLMTNSSLNGLNKIFLTFIKLELFFAKFWLSSNKKRNLV